MQVVFFSLANLAIFKHDQTKSKAEADPEFYEKGGPLKALRTEPFWALGKAFNENEIF